MGVEPKTDNLKILLFRLATGHMCSQFPAQELNLGPLPWKHRFLATRPPEKSHRYIFEICLSAGNFKTKPLLGKNRGKPGQCSSSWQRAKGRANSKIEKGGMGEIKGNIVWYQGCFRVNVWLRKHISNSQPFICSFTPLKWWPLGIMSIRDFFFFSHRWSSDSEL